MATDNAPEVSSKGRALNRPLVAFAFGAAGIILLLRMQVLLASGGDKWRQADWLINYSAGAIRRGLSGEFFLGLANLTSVEVLTLLGAVQLGLIGIVLAAFWVRLARLGFPDHLVLAVLSPALVVFWINDPGAAFRKELLLYLAFVPLLFSGSAKLRAVLSVALFAVAALFHEANAFFAPLLGIAFYIRCSGEVTPKSLKVFVGSIGAVAVGAIALALAFPSVADTGAICARLMDHGIKDAFCGGIIAFLAQGIDENLGVVAANYEIASIWEGVLVAGLCLLPVVLAVGLAQKNVRDRGLILLGCFAILPLFVISIDWGRWLSALTFTLVMIAMLPGANSRVEQGKRLPLPIYLGGLALFLFVGLLHVSFSFVDGFLLTVTQFFWHLFAA